MAVFPNHFPHSLKVYGSLSFSSPPPLVVTISHAVPSYFIQTLPLIRLPISLVHSSRSLFFIPPNSLSSSLYHLLCFSIYLPQIPQCHSFSWPSLTLSSTLFSLFYFHAALSQWAVYRNHINQECEGELGERAIGRETFSEVLSVLTVTGEDHLSFGFSLPPSPSRDS